MNCQRFQDYHCMEGGSQEITLKLHILSSCVYNLHEADGIMYSVMSADIAVLCSCVL